ncbi:hypothetical protein F4821DRAFT_274887 [Hypoxylon rubiginosum]|uniref:Uncharacterized protein n=1 Tax=Hypoxylon rubiginosum TaxID=110542 RepID=A0ACC0CM73_9PEZI|nr:hypothetical protein F4821DRAFT_274887 [Hypoxylon rubiginosum]
MPYPPATRRAILGAGAVLFVIALLSYQDSFRLDNSLTSTLTSAKNTICRVWPGQSLYEELYDDCDETIKSPFIGVADTLGNPQRCLKGSSRLRHQITPGHNWSEVEWGFVQRQCAAFEHKLSASEYLPHHIWRRPADPQTVKISSEKRTAIVLRTWDDYEYTEKRLTWLRTLITEASLQRPGKYQVFFLVNVKDPNIQLEEDDAAYDQALRQFVPEEFRDMALLFNERTLKAWYPLVQEHGAQDQMYQALQIFSQKFQQYDYIWQLEMDLRFTANVHDTLQSATAFARAQRQRNLWERNGRFYIPHLYNTYENFSAVVDAEFGDTGIWGPVQTPDFIPKGIQPPRRVNNHWGIGEEADLISFMPMIDPVGTNWVYENNIYNFEAGAGTPRRAAIVSITRSSRRLLQLISDAQLARGQWLVSEATLETFALLHGLKAVTVPHLISFSEETKMEDLLGDINKGPPHSKAGGDSPSMLYTKNGFLPGPWWEASYWFTGNGAAKIWDEYVDGKLLPPMLLHPVKEK